MCAQATSRHGNYCSTRAVSAMQPNCGGKEEYTENWLVNFPPGLIRTCGQLAWETSDTTSDSSRSELDIYLLSTTYHINGKVIFTICSWLCLMVTFILITPVLVQLAVPSIIAYSMHFAPSMLHCILVNVNAPQLVSKNFIGENAQHKPQNSKNCSVHRYRISWTY